MCPSLYKYNNFLGYAWLVNYVYDGRIQFKVSMRATPTLDSGSTFTVSGGNAGTPQIYSAASSINSGDVVNINNSGSSWTISANISLTAGFSAEL